MLAAGPSTSPSLSRFQPCLWSRLGQRGSGMWAALSSRWILKPFEKSTWEGRSLWGLRRPRLPSGCQPTSGNGVPQVLGASLLLCWRLVRGCSPRTW